MMARTALWGALLAVQSEASTMRKDASNPHFKSKYLSLPALMEQGLPLLTSHGLAWSAQPCGTADEPRLRYTVAHAESGEELTESMPTCPAKRDPQGMGSGITYAKRYAFESTLGFVADEDDDGNAASARAPRAPSRRTARSTVAKAETLRRVKALIRETTEDNARLALVAVGVDAGDGKVGEAVKGLTQVQAEALILRLPSKE